MHKILSQYANPTKAYDYAADCCENKIKSTQIDQKFSENQAWVGIKFQQMKEPRSYKQKT